MRDRARAKTPGAFMRNVEKTAKTIVNNTATSTGAYTPRIQKRSVASQDISWNGRPETFPVLQERVEAVAYTPLTLPTKTTEARHAVTTDAAKA